MAAASGWQCRATKLAVGGATALGGAWQVVTAATAESQAAHDFLLGVRQGLVACGSFIHNFNELSLTRMA